MKIPLRPEVDGLRALAVVPVILFHAGVPGFGGGFVGVDIFFVISGYLITRILARELDAGAFSLAGFYERRARRILPALTVVVLACVPMAWLWLPPPEMMQFAQSVASLALFSSNLLFWHQEGYFAPASELKPLLHTWSLAVEEQYYLAYPLLLAAFWKAGRRRVIALLAVIGMGSLALSVWGTFHAASAAFYLAPFRAWELLAGSLCGLLPFTRQGRAREALAAIGVALLAAAIFGFDRDTPFPGYHALLPVLGTMLILQCASIETRTGRALAWAPLVAIGLISYTAYLWHQPLFAFARIALSSEPALPVMAALILASFALAWLTTRFVETPFRRSARRLLAGRRAMLGSAAAILAGFAAAGVAGHVARGFPQRAAIPAPVLRDLTERPRAADCMDRSRAKRAEPGDWFCELGAPAARRVIAVYGDSHALSFLPLLDRWGRARGVTLRFSAMSGCPPLIDLQVLRNDEKRFDCAARNRDAFSPAQLAAADAAVLIGRWTYYTTGDVTGGFRFVGTGGTIASDRSASAAAFFEQFRRTLDAMRAADLPVLILHQAPVQRVEPGRAFFEASRGGSPSPAILRRLSVTPEEHRHAYGALAAKIDALARGRQNAVRTLDIAQRLCARDACLIGDGQHSRYFDRDHVSVAGADSIQDLLYPALDALAAPARR